MSTTPLKPLLLFTLGMKVFGISVISDMGVEGQVVEINHEEVQEVANIKSTKINLVSKRVLKNFK